MTAERGDNAGVRLHVGGLVRGVDPNELAALIARTLPSGTASPKAEIMRDASTGIERGFGYVSIPGGEGVKAGAERAIAAYDGARWKGSKIRVGFAKGDYLQRLQAEWDAAAAAAKNREEKASAPAVGKTPVPPTVTYKARPFLRLRRRPGERVILVDPTPIAWAKPSRKDPRARSKKEEEGREEGGDAGAHRRKRGVLGGRRRVEFPGREATCSTKCRELWRRHLQERAAEASAARLRSVDRLISGQGAGAVAATAAAGAGEVVVVPNGEALSRSREVTQQQSAAAEYPPIEDAADLGPEEPPPSEGIEFVWDDAAEEGSGSDDSVAEEEEEEEDEEDEEEEEHQPVEDTKHGAAAAVSSLEGGEEEEESVDGRGEDSHRNPTPPPVSPAAAAAATATGRTASKRLERLGEKHGIELDDRLAELLSDGSDDDDGGVYGEGGYDYELETAKREGAAAEAAAAAAAGEGTVEGMRDRLQAETERSLGVLAAIFGGGGGGGNATAGSAPPPTAAAASSSSTPAASGPESRGPARGAVVAAAAAPDDKPDSEAMAAASLPVHGGETAATEGVGGGSGKSAGEEGERGSREGEEDATGRGGGGVGHQDGGGGPERFVAHMSALTDIFTVKDKVSTKKNREEKDKDKGFKITSLFDAGLTAGAATAENPTPAGGDGVGGTTTGLFSFGFGGERAGAPAAAAAAGDGGTGAVPVEGQARSAASLSLATAATAAAAAASVSDGGHADGESQPGGPLPISNGGGGGGGAVVAETALWRPLDEVVAVAARFMRTGKREDVETAWLGERRALTQDFKRKHKDAVKGRRGATAAGGGGVGHSASKIRRR